MKSTILVVAVLLPALTVTTLVLAPAAADEEKVSTGTITGTLKTRPKKYAKWAVVYLKEVKGDWKPPAEKPVIDQKNLKFVPHVLPIVKGTTVVFKNSDDVQHNVHCPKKYNLGTWGKGETKEHKYDELGEFVQLCNIHLEMEAWVLVLQNPFFTVVGEDGGWKLENVPPGDYVLVAWSEKLKGAEAKVTVKAGETAKHGFSLKGKK